MNSTCQGSSVKTNILVACIGKGNEKSPYSFIVNDLANVKFRFIQTLESPYRLQTQMQVCQASKDLNVKVKVYCKEYNYRGDKIYSDKKCWEVIGDSLFSSLDHGEMYVFELCVTIHSCKVQIIQEILYNDTEFTDFRLITDEGSVPVHKAYLAAQSDVFKAMLTREWTEAKEGRIQMEGVSLQTLQHFKDYMYLGTLPDDVLPLLSIGSCYMIENLKNDCLWNLSQKINADNFYDILGHSIATNDPELTFAILKVTPIDVVASAEEICMKKLEKPVNEEDKTN